MMRLFLNAVGVVLLAAVVGAFLGPEVMRTALEHITGGLQELVSIGENLGRGEVGQRLADFVRQIAGRL